MLREQRRAGSLYDAMNPQKDAQTTFRGGVRSVVGCGVSADETGTFCVGGSETGQILAWRLPDVGTSKPEALPLEIDVKARNARCSGHADLRCKGAEGDLR